MSLRTRLQVSVVVLAGGIVVALSILYIRSIIEDSFAVARNIAESNARQVEALIASLAPGLVAELDPPPQNLDEIVQAYVAVAEQELDLNRLLETLMANSPVIVEGLVTGPDDRILAASINGKVGQKHTPLPPLSEFEKQGLSARIREVFSSSQDYEIERELGLELGGRQRRVLTVRMIVSLVLMRESLWPRVRALGLVSGVALLFAMAAATLVSRIAVKPLRQIGDLIDSIAAGAETKRLASASSEREVAAVESKLNLLGKQFQGAQADAEQLRTNIDQLLTRLEEAVFLFGRDDRLVMAGGSAERFSQGGRWQLMGRLAEEIFPASTELGAFVQSAMQLRRVARNTPVAHELDGRPLMLAVSIEVIEDFPSHERVGTLITLREMAARQEIELQLDISTRLAAISRLTGGVAHEIKNPLNSIALHLEVLRTKLEEADIGQNEIEVISREIRRLDRVVKSFLDFTRPVELELSEFDLSSLLEELAGLVAPDARENGVDVQVEREPGPAILRGDRDLLKQALLNVIVNGIQAMPDGGTLTIGLIGRTDAWEVAIRDTGSGIPAEIQEQIFDLYFTTKGKGSGIGLAMTFQVIQLHGGTIDVKSEVGQGAEFRLRLPAYRSGSDTRTAASIEAPE